MSEEDKARVDYFIDTNIIAYAFDKSGDKTKWKKCRDVVKEGFQGGLSCFVSNQVLAELFVVLTTKVTRPLSTEKASVIVKSFVDSPKWTKVTYDPSTVSRTVTDSCTVTAPFWDLLIAETMKEAGVTRIYTENLENFKGIPWVQAIDPISRDKTGKER